MRWAMGSEIARGERSNLTGLQGSIVEPRRRDSTRPVSGRPHRLLAVGGPKRHTRHDLL